MSARKRHLDVGHSSRKSKKVKLSADSDTGGVDGEQASPALPSESVDFPRGGGTNLTPLEVKAARTEAVKEANDELFARKLKKRKRNQESTSVDAKSKTSRIDHLSYKRMTVGMKILGQVTSVQPLALVISLPDQLLGHVPITEISTQLTALLEATEERGDTSATDDEDDLPDLSELFCVGQYIRAVVTAVHAPGTTGAAETGKRRDDVVKPSRRVELSIVPGKINAGVHKSDLRSGFTLSAAVKSIEDHGYQLDMGIPDVAGFLPFKDVKRDSAGKLHVGQILDVVVVKMSSNARTCKVVLDKELFASATMSEVVNITSVLPGMLVDSLVTDVQQAGLNLQVLGFFEGTINQFHLPEKSQRPGRKLKSRVLYVVQSTPPKLALSLVEHILDLVPCKTKTGSGDPGAYIQEAYPVGTLLEAVKVVRVESERGLIVEVAPHLQGYVHISHVSDEHTPSLSAGSGPWKVGSTHQVRVTGYFALDGLLQLSLRPSVLSQKFLRASDVPVGEIVKGTIKSLDESKLTVTISGNLSGVVWPLHYADITLKHPSKRFKVGKDIKCRVVAVEPDRGRIALTAKKSLVESDLPILSKFEDAKVGLLALGVVVKVGEKSLVVEFYNKVKAVVSAKEASETGVVNLSESFVVGKVVKVRIISVNPEELRIQASICQASPNFESPATDVSNIEISDVVEGAVTDIHETNAVLSLHATGARALISLKNIANHRGKSVAELRSSLKQGDKLEDLVVVTRNPEKGFVIVAHKSQRKTALPTKASISMDTLTVGQIVMGRVTGHTQRGAVVKLSSHVSGFLHPTDTTDNYEAGNPFPTKDSVMKVVVVHIDREAKSLALSTRGSRMHPGQDSPVADREIQSLADLKGGDTVRGFIKSVAEHGLFVTLGRGIDARVQIKELFDELRSKYVKDWKARFSANQLVKGRVVRVDVEKNQVEMSFRSGNLRRDSDSLSLADIREGQIINGRIKKIEDYGLFIEIDGSKLSGLCHKSQLSDNVDADVTVALRSFREGDKVKAMICSIDQAKRRISFGLKPSYFTSNGAADAQADADESEGEEETQAFGVVDDPDGDSHAEGHVPADDESDSPLVDHNEEGDYMRPYVETQRPSSPPVGIPDANSNAPVQLMKLGGFRWTGGFVSDEDEKIDSSGDENDDRDQKGTDKKRKRKEIDQDLTATMHSRAPESSADFDRLLLGSPNSSYLWVQYMSFQLQLAEVEKAREIGRRALETIHFREDREKLNVWIALLNLENRYGMEESLETTFKDAARHNDSKAIHLSLANIFDQTEKYDKAEEQYKRTCKKFGRSSKVWTLFAQYYLRRGEVENARKLLPRGLQSLEQRKHIKTISKFAQLEYKLGDPERGRTIFEGVVNSHPKRWDLWSIYMDMEAGQSDIQNLRNLFDRVLALKMTSNKAKSFLKKWLQLEKRLGDEEGEANVKQKAVEWMQRATKS